MPKPFGYIATYLDVLPQLLDMTFIIPNTTHPMCFSLRDTSPCFRSLCLFSPATLSLPAALGCNTSHLSDYSFSIHCEWICMQGVVCGPLTPSPLAWVPSFRTLLHLPVYHGVIHGPFRAEASLYGWATCVVLLCRNHSFG